MFEKDAGYGRLSCSRCFGNRHWVVSGVPPIPPRVSVAGDGRGWLCCCFRSNCFATDFAQDIRFLNIRPLKPEPLPYYWKNMAALLGDDFILMIGWAGSLTFHFVGTLTTANTSSAWLQFVKGCLGLWLVDNLCARVVKQLGHDSTLGWQRRHSEMLHLAL